MTPLRTNATSVAKERLRLWLNMLKAVRHVENDVRERLRAQYQMTLPQFDVMATLHNHPEGLRMSDLSQQLVVSNGNVTGIVERLVADGLAERENLESDRRASLVRVSEKGNALMDEMVVVHREWIDEIFQDISEPDAARAISIMLDIRQRRCA
ncbi:MarR family transcriptional regulator [Phyllobacterium phragmitis]|uniref:MarR family transcriptional regulator n=1 Tax=Phyllobacterium phragmitis TaxID=2670329 RepID=A0A2S9IT50_9HYPH|nr:MarR family transcriptional regulator [Phyllobacterium phragmitis]PRD43670.1 MarR family transcriptional regulator [Phyllobacterium phragmitis]